MRHLKPKPDIAEPERVNSRCGRTVAKRMRARLSAIKLELPKRIHQPVRETGQWLKSVMTGYYRYHAVHGNLPMMERFRRRGGTTNRVGNSSLLSV